MAFVELQSLSHTSSARALRSVAPENGRASMQPSAADDPFGPAVVNHVQGGKADAASTGQAESASGGKAGSTSGDEEDPAEAEEVRKLQARDAEVRAHEQAH